MSPSERRQARDDARRWLWEHSIRDRQRACGRDLVGGSATLVRSAGVARFGGLETCGSVWSCPVCSARILARRGDELTRALQAADARGDRVAMVTLTMRHRADHSLAGCWDALSDAWAAASGRHSAVRREKSAAGVQGWVRRVEATWGSVNGWHVHVHALVLLREPDRLPALAGAMFRAWELRLRRVGLTPVADRGGLDARLLDLSQAVSEVGGYVTKGSYEALDAQAAALELAGPGKLGRAGNLTPWQILDAARAGDRRSAAVWAEWERASRGRRALTWSQGLRDALLPEPEADDETLAATEPEGTETVCWWPAADWPAIRDAYAPHRAQLLAIAADGDLDQAAEDVHRWCQILGLPTPRPRPPDL